MTPLHIDPRWIHEGVFWIIFFLSFLSYIKYYQSSSCKLLLKQEKNFWPIVLAVFFIFFMGLRPRWYGFGDSGNYIRGYNELIPVYQKFNWKDEWLFRAYEVWCKRMGFTWTTFLLIIEIGYIGFMVWACKKALWENMWLAVLFCFSAFSFYTYGVNGLRNGLACSIVTLAIVLLSNKNTRIWAIILFYCAFGIHRSTMIPSAMAFVSYFVIKRPKSAFYLWLLSIPLSLVVGSFFTSLFEGMGFDDRTSKYMSGAYLNENTFSSTGFRWDFLLYSAMPVWLIWYVNKKIDERRAMMGGFCKEEQETGVVGAGIMADVDSMRLYNLLASTYLLSNMFWIFVIRAAFSNRFAYLSWFLYPFVLAYALIRLKIWSNQDKKIGIILLLHASFTIFMHLIGKA